MFHDPEAARRATGFGAPQRLDMAQAKIMAVDDSAQALDIITQVLLGFKVRHARSYRSVAEALNVARGEPLDLVIVDAEMPDEDGFDLIREIRGDPNGINFTTPIILMSGFTPRPKIERARDAGANLVIKKPIVPGVLLSRIEWLARSPRQFVASQGYCGPDRRFKNGPLPEGVTERRADGLRMMAQPERAMSQDEIDSLFN